MAARRKKGEVTETEWLPKEKRPKRAPGDPCSRMLRLDVFPTVEIIDGESSENLKLRRDELRKKIINSLRKYRYACRWMMSILFAAETAGASIEEDKEGFIRVKPDSERARQILDLACEKSGKAHCYQFYDLWKARFPDFYSCVFSLARAEISSIWNTRHQQGGTVGFRNMQGAAMLSRFMKAPLPVLKSKDFKEYFVPRKYGMRLRWDYSIGDVEFKIVGKRNGKLDPARAYLWHQIESGKLESSTLKLFEHKGRFFVNVPYKLTPEETVLDPERTLEISATGDIDKFFVMSVREGHKTYIDELRSDAIGVNETVSWLEHLRAQQKNYEKRHGSCGTRSECAEGTGHRKAYRSLSDKREALSTRRSDGGKTWNHVWAKRLVNVAQRWRCAKIVVFDLPAAARRDEETDEPIVTTGLRGHSWQWFDFKGKMESKAMMKRMTVTFVQSATLKEMEKEVLNVRNNA